MELRHLRYFVAVAEELNFTRAAEKLRTAQPSLSQQIRDLESEIGTPLLARTKRRVELTAAGQVFLDEARLVLAQAKQAITLARRAAEDEAGTLAIGFLPAAEVKIFPSMLTAMRAQFPQLQLLLRSLTTLEQREALLNDSIDVAFLRLPADDPRIAWEIVLTERLVAVLPANHPLAAQPDVSATELGVLPFLRIEPAHAGSLHGVIESFFRDQRVEPRLSQDVENVLTLMTLVGMGEGFSVLPDYAEHLLFKNVVSRPFRQAAPAIALAMAWRRDDDSRELQAFRELVHATLGLGDSGGPEF